MQHDVPCVRRIKRTWRRRNLFSHLYSTFCEDKIHLFAIFVFTLSLWNSLQVRNFEMRVRSNRRVGWDEQTLYIKIKHINSYNLFSYLCLVSLILFFSIVAVILFFMHVFFITRNRMGKGGWTSTKQVQNSHGEITY